MKDSTVARLIDTGARRLAAARLHFGHGTSSARQEAAWLVAHALKAAPASLARLLGKTPSRQQAAAALRLFERRIRERRPAAYLVREAWLADLPFYVDERVVVPRSHIAGLLRDAVAPWIPNPRSIRSALDLCTGSGCLAVLMARAFRSAAIDAADISGAALQVARRNVTAHRLSRRIRLVESDLFAALGSRRYDLIVSNPPYVRTASMRRLPAEYRHEPRIALAGGTNGLDCVSRILGSAARHLQPAGQLVVEVGAGRRETERAFPGVAFLWPETPGGYPVFIVSREQLEAAGYAGRGSRRRKKRGPN